VISPVEAFAACPALLWITVGFVGLCVGSFLNVVIYRVPIMMEREFRDACHEQFGVPELPKDEEPLTLSRPASRCGHCGTPIKPWHNIPVLAWVLLKGRCASCHAAISIQYPLVELITGLMSLACVWRFGLSPELPGALVLTWFLVALTVIDLKTFYLPDVLTLPLVWLGLLGSLWLGFTSPTASIIGAAIGYLSLWSIYHLFKQITGKEGMGYGDFKLLAALGAWLGWTALPLIILMSAVVGSVVGISLILARKAEWSSRIPFGPYLAGAGWLVMMGGNALVDAWLHMSHP